MGYVQGHQGGCANVEDDFLWFPKVRNVLNFYHAQGHQSSGWGGEKKNKK